MKNSPIIPCYADRYLCFSVKKTFSFDELIRLFFDSEIEDDQIGAISLIAENYPDELYEFILHNDEIVPLPKKEFLLQKVVYYNLPLLLPKESFLNYNFEKDYSNDVWVKMLKTLRQYG